MFKALGILLLSFICSTLATAQNLNPTSPIYTKVITHTGTRYLARISPFKDNGKYFINWQSSQDEMDIGIFSPFIMDTLNSSLNQKVFFYDNNLVPTSEYFEIKNLPYFTNSRSTGLVGYSNNKWYFYSASPGGTDFSSEPPFSSTIPVSNWQKVVYSYNSAGESIEVLFTIDQGSGSSPLALPNYGLKSGSFEIGNGSLDQFQSFQLSNGKIIGAFGLHSSHTIQGTSYNTFDPELSIFRLGFGEVIIDPNLETIDIHTVINPRGEFIHKRLFSSKSEESLYRIMISRGDSIQMSWNTPTPVHFENDTTYRVLLVKENMDGETVWYNQLYGFNNSAPDSSILEPIDFNMRTSFTSLIDNGDNLFLSDRFYSFSTNNDTLIWTDPMGTTTTIPPVNPSSQGVLQQSKNLLKSSVVKLNSDGIVQSRLEFDELQYIAPGFMDMNPQLFEVNDFLVWKLPFQTEVNTSIQLQLKTDSGQTQSYTLPVPAGKWLLLIWLNDNLEVINQWNFPYSATQTGLLNQFDITYMSPFKNDTLLIQGNFGLGSSTSLDPTGQAETIFYENQGTFFAFYSLPGIVNTIANTTKSQNWSLLPYPNPARHEIHINLPPSTNGYIFLTDISGRTLKVKSFIENQKYITLNTESLRSGVYIVTLNSETVFSSAKVVIE